MSKQGHNISTSADKKDKNKSLYWLIGAVVVIIIILMLGLGNRNGSPKPAASVNPDNLPGIQTGNAPWANETDHLKDRLSAIGLSALAEEGSALHTHQHLDIYIDGKSVPVPADIGINEAANFVSPIHTHDSTAVIHVESPTVQDFTLGQFFDVWGVKLTDQCIGGYCNAGDKKLKVYVNGSLMSGNPRDIKLEERQEIVAAYGTNSEPPNPIPSSYNFPAGE